MGDRVNRRLEPAVLQTRRQAAANGGVLTNRFHANHMGSGYAVGSTRLILREQRETIMEYRLLGRTGVRVSPFCLGTMNLGGPTSEADSFAILRHAVEAGLNFIDTSGWMKS